MNKILSISVAAYNVENFIKTNLDSFVNSEVKDDIEVLVTDDESKDETAKIVLEYEKKYPNIVKLIRQKNAGPGSTVNSGIKNATGKYFRMVDADDWVDTKNLKEYIEFLKKHDADMIVTNYTLVDNETNEETRKVFSKKETNTVLDFNENCNDVEFEMHNVTYKTEILKNNNIILDNGFYTDVEYLLLPFPFVKTIAYLDTNIYMYRVSLSTQSVSTSSKQKNIAMHETVLKRLINYYEETKKSGRVGNNVLNYMLDRISIMAVSHLLILLSFEPNKSRKKEIKELFSYLKSTSIDIYKKFSVPKKVKALAISNFMLYKMVSNKYRKENI